MNQITMTGEDWLSDRDRKAQARAEARRKKAAVDCAKKLDAAVDSVRELIYACNDCDDGSGVRGIDDSRQLLIERMDEYAGWLHSVYGAQR